ncbi:sugar porter (SP) family MFS transporter [Nocardia transvalensis]|uniref:Sugar porter (SP) family MFS transporter n=1 Tax=Nocardia transvalensis TaxID=37333 RepID=A0A7W9PL56_9NOCA|nr:sugar porter family MFS transporter [Nocardia transvalensis]MBB5917639.1 sugar porter (SP) family MFS transporter [Nocardia transvalensis]
MPAISQVRGTAGPLEQISHEGKRKIIVWASLIAVGGFLFGFDTGVVSGALLFITRDFDLNAAQQGSIVSVLLIGAMIGAMSAGSIADSVGRKRALSLEGAIFIVGTALAISAQDYWVLLLARIVLGLAVGAASATVPVYLSEISPAEIRGRILSMNQLLITVGILVSYLVDLAFASSGSWRWMFAAGFVPATILCFGTLLFVPESAAWLVGAGRSEQARGLILKVTDAAHADALIGRYEQRLHEQQQENARDHRSRRQALLAPAVRPALIVALAMAVIQQFGGINTIIYFAPTIIESTGLSASNSIYYSVYIGIINLVMTVIAMATIDRLGRRKLLLGSLAGMAVAVTLLGISFIGEMNSVLSLVFMVLYIAAFAAGLGPVFWVLVGEIFPPQVRAIGSSSATTTNWLSNFAVSQAFLPLTVAIGQGQAFLIFGVICVLGLLFVARYVPETKDRTDGQIAAALDARFHHQPPRSRLGAGPGIGAHG